MTALTLFLLGTVVTLITVTALVMVGLAEAADPDHSRSEDLTDWEWSIVKQERARLTAERPADAEPGGPGGVA